MDGIYIPGSDASAATQALIETQTDKIPRLISGMISTLGIVSVNSSGLFDIQTETDKIPRLLSGMISTLGIVSVNSSGLFDIQTETDKIPRLISGMISTLEQINAIGSNSVEVQKTVYGYDSYASGKALTGSGWVEMMSIPSVSKPTLLAAITVSVSGDMIGSGQYMITDESDVKMFPSIDANVFNTGQEQVFSHTINVPSGSGYKVKVRSTSNTDASGKTISLDMLSKIELG